MSTFNVGDLNIEAITFKDAGEGTISMRLYSYMDYDAYKALLTNGSIVGSPKHSDYQEFEQAYGWLANAMDQRIGMAPVHCNPQWPVFAWSLHDGLDPLVYDKESTDIHADFLVGFEPPEGSYLLSDFDDWHFILNDWFLPSCGSDDDAGMEEMHIFDNHCAAAGYDKFGRPGKSGPSAEIEAMRRSHWGRIIDFPLSSGSVQASLWEIKKEWIFLVRARTHNGILKMARSRRKSKRGPGRPATLMAR